MELEISKQITDLVAIATNPIIDQESLDRACTASAMGKGLIRKIRGYFAPMKQGAYDSWRRICAQENEEIAKVEPKVAAIDRVIVDFRIEQDRIRREAEEKARRQEEERRRLEEETLRKAQEVERRAEEEKRRAEEEARRKERAAKTEAEARSVREESARRQAEADRRAKEEQDRILTAAAAKESKLEPIVVVPEKIVNKDLSRRDNWTYEIIDEGLIPREYCIPDWVRIGKLARIEKSNLKIPGIRAVNKPIMAARPGGTK